MTRDTQKLIKKNKQEAAELVRYANPKSKSRPSIDRVMKILLPHIPYCGIAKPVITKVEVSRYSQNSIIKCAYFRVETADSKAFEISVYQKLTGRKQAEKEADKTATFPSGLFNIFHDEIIPA